MRRRSEWIYVAVSGDMTKIGVACDPEKRVKQWQSLIGSPVRLVWCLHHPERTRRLEADVMKELAAHRVRNEWFSVSARRAAATVKMFVSGRGKRGPKPRPTWHEIYEQECRRWGKEAVDAALERWNRPVVWPDP